MVALIVPRLAVELAPRIQDNIVDGFAAVTPFTAAAGSKSTSQPLSVPTEAGIEVINVKTVKIHPARYQELYRVVGSKASFLSKEQAAAVELTAQQQHDLFIVLGTGGGKSLVFMAAAANAQEMKQRLITVVVVPLKALLEDLCWRMDEKKIIYSKWTSRSPEVPGPNKLKPEERILLYCLSKKDTESLAHLLKCDYYHSVIEDEAQREIYKGWISNSRSSILTTTSCLSAGMDYTFVCMVVHWKLPCNLLDKEQEAGRAGRDGEEAHSVVFWDPTDRGIGTSKKHTIEAKNFALTRKLLAKAQKEFKMEY
ncbi:P-loop containing nucleoside triphosphate hydrolase protein [Phlegmacium glaucopus]|nr:P-loop containing nucleoside triphosphate hydrolase protein [Phlegmacium glaucopus]